MKRAILSILTVTALSVAYASFFSALDRPAALINLPLILIVYSATGLRILPAVGAAFVSGTVLDNLSAVPYGTYTVSMVLVAAVAVLLFSTVLTHLSLLSYIGANAGAFVVFHAAAYLLASMGRMFTGSPFPAPGSGDALVAVMAALPIQLIVCAVVRIAVNWRTRTRPRYMILR